MAQFFISTVVHFLVDIRNLGPQKAWIWLLEWINKNIGKVCNDKLNRVDICCHSDSFCFSIADLDRFSGRYRKDAIHRDNRNFTGFEFGSRASDTIIARIYNKTKETVDKKLSSGFLIFGKIIE